MSFLSFYLTEFITFNLTEFITGSRKRMKTYSNCYFIKPWVYLFGHTMPETSGFGCLGSKYYILHDGMRVPGLHYDFFLMANSENQ